MVKAKRMSFHDDSEDPDWKVTKLKTEPGTVKNHHSTTNKVKYSQKFCEKWLNIFSPWLTRCEDDPNKPFCKACQCRLDCNRCHLQRHERTSKHGRNLEILINKGEGAARQNLSIRQERSKYYQQRKKVDSSIGSQEDSYLGLEDYIDEGDQETSEYGYEQTDMNAVDQYSHEENICKQEVLTVEEINNPVIVTRSTSKNTVGRPRKVPKAESDSVQGSGEEIVERKDPVKRMMQIQKDKTELMDSFKELMGGTNQHHSAQREKNHVDLFFESVSSSVKALSPKLIAESKMRVSQLICELELRALTENEQANNGQTPGSTVVVSQENGGGTYIINESVSHVGTNQRQLGTNHNNEIRHYDTLS